MAERLIEEQRRIDQLVFAAIEHVQTSNYSVPFKEGKIEEEEGEMDDDWIETVELHLKLSQVLHLKVTHLEEPEYGSSVLGFSSFCLLGFLRRAVFEAVAIVAGFNDVAVMSQPVE